MSEGKKSKYLTKTVHFKGQSLTMFSLDGVTWSTKKAELEVIKERQEAQRASLLNGKVSSAPLPGGGDSGYSGGGAHRGQGYSGDEESEPREEGFEREPDESPDAGFDETELDREEEELNTNLIEEEREEDTEPSEKEKAMPDLLGELDEKEEEPAAAAKEVKRGKEKPQKKPTVKSPKAAEAPQRKVSPKKPKLAKKVPKAKAPVRPATKKNKKKR